MAVTPLCALGWLHEPFYCKLNQYNTLGFRFFFNKYIINAPLASRISLWLSCSPQSSFVYLITVDTPNSLTLSLTTSSPKLHRPPYICSCLSFSLLDLRAMFAFHTHVFLCVFILTMFWFCHFWQPPVGPSSQPMAPPSPGTNSSTNQSSSSSTAGWEQLSKTNLYIRGLPPATTDHDLVKLCQPWVHNFISLSLFFFLNFLALVNALDWILASYKGSNASRDFVCVFLTGMDEEIGEKPPADLNNWLWLINPNCTLRGMSCYEMEIDYGSRRGIWPQIHKHQSCVSARLQIPHAGSCIWW